MKNEKEDWYEELREKYPELLKQVHYCSVRDGWKDIIIKLCDMISNHSRQIKDEDSEKPVVLEIKEKFGGLRFYAGGLDDYIRGLIDMAEAMSYTTCEVCGKPGKPRKGGWIQTLCDEHYAEIK